MAEPQEGERWRLKKTKRGCDIVSRSSGWVVYRFFNRTRSHRLERFLQLFERVEPETNLPEAGW